MESIYEMLFGSSSREEDGEQGPPINTTTTTSTTTNDTVISVGSGEHESDGEEAYIDDDLYSSDNDSDYEYNPKEVEYNSADKATRREIDQLVHATRDVYIEPREMISTVYKQFAMEYPTVDMLNRGALEYIVDNSEIDEGTYNPAVNQSGYFKCIFYDTLATTKMYPRPECCKAIGNGAGDVFLVSQQLDFVYGHVIEHAILKSNNELFRRAYDQFALRKQNTTPCISAHIQSVKCCPSEWVLYVNTNSEFYTYCSKVLKTGTPEVDFALAPQYIGSESLSFYLVLLLCGHMLPTVAMETLSIDGTTKAEHYTQVNRWKKLPVYFLAIWAAGHPTGSTQMHSPSQYYQ